MGLYHSEEGTKGHGMKLEGRGTSLVVQWLGLGTSTAGGTGSIPGWRTNILHDKQCSQKKRKKEKKEEIGRVSRGLVTGHIGFHRPCNQVS